MVVVVAGTWGFSSCSLTGPTTARGTTDQHRQYDRNGRKIKIIILWHGTEAMLRPLVSDRLRSFLVGRVAPSHHVPAPLHFAPLTSPTLTLASLGLRIVRTGVPAEMLYVVKFIVDAVVAGRADPASGVPETDWLADPGLRHRPIGQSTNDSTRRRGVALTRSFKDTMKARRARPGVPGYLAHGSGRPVSGGRPQVRQCSPA